MAIKILNDDLFRHLDGRIPVHCISTDYAMGAGIAVPMAKKFNLHAGLKGMISHTGDVLFVNGVLNMITKTNVWDKPTLPDMEKTLHTLKDVCIKKNLYKLVMPKIGCGLDMLSWENVSELIEKIFDNRFDILVCVYHPERSHYER